MKYLDYEIVKPFVGIGQIKLGMNYEDAIKVLKNNNIVYSMGIDSNKGCTPEVPWKKVFVKDYMVLWFAEDVLWQISFEGEFKGSLENGIKIGTSIEDAQSIDDELEYDDWNEIWSSDNGYRLVDTVESNKVIIFSIFIKEVLDDDAFYSYNWVKDYKK